MTEKNKIGLQDVQNVYSSAEGDLWELIMGHQIHIGGFKSSMDLAERAQIGSGQRGVDLCSCNGAGMRFLVRFRGVAKMLGVDATPHVVERSKARCAAEGLADKIESVCADVCQSGLPTESVDFAWGEDAWCYVEDKPRLIAEAARLVRSGGKIAFTDWVLGSTPMTSGELERFLAFMKFPNLQSIEGYKKLLEKNGCRVIEASDTGRFAAYMDLYLEMLDKQLTYDALRILGFDMNVMQQLGGEMQFVRELAHAGKIAQGRFIAQKA